MNYELIEQSIVDRLAPIRSAFFDVKLRPTTEAAYKTPTQKATVFVGYTDGSFHQITDKPNIKTTDVMVQDEVVNIELAFQARELRGDRGLFKLIELAKKALVGFKPVDCTKLFMVRMDPPMYVENLWTYTLVMSCDARIVEHDTEDYSTLISRITLEDAPPFTETITIE